jgi:hypothetical protein
MPAITIRTTAIHTAEPGQRSGGAAGRRWREAAASLAALAAFHLAAAACLRPIWRVWRGEMVPSDGDPIFCLYLLKWVGHEAGRRFAGFWDPPFFHPARGVLAYSDHLFGPGLVATAWNALVPGWVGAYNVLLLSSFALSGWTLAWVLRRSGRSWPAAFAGGLIYAFCPFRWDELPHIQVLFMAAIPLVLWSFDRLLAAPSWARGAAFLAAYAVHLSGGSYLAGMIQFPLLVLAVNRAPELWRRRQELGRRGWAVLALTAAAAAGLLGATFWEYWRIQAQEHLAWETGAQREWGATLLSYLQPGRFNLLGPLWPASVDRPENSLFPGLTAVALCIAGLWARRRRAGVAGADQVSDPGAGVTGGPPARPAWWILPTAAAAAGFILSDLVTLRVTHHLGGSVGRGLPAGSSHLAMLLAGVGLPAAAVLWRRRQGRWPGAWVRALAPWPRGVLLAGMATALLALPLLYLPLARLVPGLDGMRVPARFQAFTMLSVAVAAAAGLDALTRRLRMAGGRGARRRAAIVAAVALAGAAIEAVPRPLDWGAVPEETDFPAVYGWLGEQPDVRALLELPIPAANWPLAGVYRTVDGMYFSTARWRPLVNGYSAHTPAYFRFLQTILAGALPDDWTLRSLARHGVSHILVHMASLSGRERRGLNAWPAVGEGRVELVYAGAGDRVYRLVR